MFTSVHQCSPVFTSAVNKVYKICNILQWSLWLLLFLSLEGMKHYRKANLTFQVSLNCPIIWTRSNTCRIYTKRYSVSVAYWPNTVCNSKTWQAQRWSYFGRKCQGGLFWIAQSEYFQYFQCELNQQQIMATLTQGTTATGCSSDEYRPMLKFYGIILYSKFVTSFLNFSPSNWNDSNSDCWDESQL